VNSRQEHAGLRLLRLSKLAESSRLAAFLMVLFSRCLIFLFYVMCHVLLSDACAFCRLVRRRKERPPLMLRSTTRRCLRRPAVKSRQEHAGVRLLRLSKLSESSAAWLRFQWCFVLAV
jgi:hypothetical protein